MPFALIITLVISFSIAAYFWFRPELKKRQIARLRQQPFPQEWHDTLHENMPLYRHIPSDIRKQLQEHIIVFMAEKNFYGCDGLTLTTTMKLVIAAQACILLLNRQHDYYPKLRSIYVYPSLFVVDHEVRDAAGVIHFGKRTLSGESWQAGKVIVSWENALKGAANPTDGDNVVFHEFAHQLDGESGHVNGAPVLRSGVDAYSVWAQVMSNAYQQRGQISFTELGAHSVLGQYAMTNPAEFFAVSTEAFFEQPVALAIQYPDLYEQLKTYYAVDPQQWCLHQAPESDGQNKFTEY